MVLFLGMNTSELRTMSSKGEIAAQQPFPWDIAALLVVASLAALKLPTLAMSAFLLAGVMALSREPQLTGVVSLALAGLSFLTSRQKAK